MTPHSGRASSAWLASVRIGPDTEFIASCPIEQVALSIDSLACNRRLVYRGIKINLTATAGSAISLARGNFRELSGAYAARPIRPALPNRHDDGPKNQPVAISAEVAPDTTATISTTPFGLAGGR
jgi:hypothetical protein